MTIVLFTLIIYWSAILLILILWKKNLLLHTWQEPYFLDTPIVIESDDWGPGGRFHSKRLAFLLDTLSQHKDSTNRPAILTANIVLSVPDVEKISQTISDIPRRLLDQNFTDVYQAMLAGIESGTFVPQLHGLEHLNAAAFARLCRAADVRTAAARTDDNWWDWESLDSPLQGHYVDGSALPSRPIDARSAREIVGQAVTLFERIFKMPTITTVAPCYLWNDDIEECWHTHSIRAIQTAGYRCIGRDGGGKYIQDKSLIRTGDKNEFGQIYLVRNVMFEPVDGKNTPETAFNEALRAKKQALPITISTHRYNFTRSEQEFTDSLAGIDRLLTLLTESLPKIRFFSSAELAEFILNPHSPVMNHSRNESIKPPVRLENFAKISPFLYRLYYRHPKLAKLSVFSGLILPAWVICRIANWQSKTVTLQFWP